MSNPFTIEARWNYGMARGNHLNDTVKVSMAILFGTAALLAFASDQVLDGPNNWCMSFWNFGHRWMYPRYQGCN